MGKRVTAIFKLTKLQKRRIPVVYAKIRLKRVKYLSCLVTLDIVTPYEVYSEVVITNFIKLLERFMIFPTSIDTTLKY